ncbi:MAG: LysM peptidoglycan-binding domain-containing protein [Anaerolineaceae bacterium]|nr:LysM peptidoglycan-binding domain-containing protein [Anaerolineaceae bacterium]
MFKPSNLILVLFLLVLLCVAVFPTQTIQAQSENAYDLINTVNTLRASKGLDPYKIDSYLMGYAQQHADYMASIQYSTHTHSDGSIAWQSGIQENVAEGSEGIITSAFVVYQIWSDWVHWHIMVDYASGDVGAGVALGTNGMVYYVLNVRPGDAIQPIVPTSGSGSAVPTSSGTRTATLDLISFLIKSTPAPDGSIIHVVGYGQSLWSIADAYGVTIDQLRSLNNISPHYTTIRTGDQLLIQPAHTPTATLSAEEASTHTKTHEPTAVPPTATLRPSRTALPSASPSPTETPLPVAAPEKEPNSMAMTVMGVSLLGLIVVVIFGFVKTRNTKNVVD